MTLTISQIEAAMREARAEVQRQTAQDYVSVEITGDGKFRVYIHGSQKSEDGGDLAAVMAAAIAAYDPSQRAKELRRRAEEMMAQAERLGTAATKPAPRDQ